MTYSRALVECRACGISPEELVSDDDSTPFYEVWFGEESRGIYCELCEIRLHKEIQRTEDEALEWWRRASKASAESATVAEQAE